MTDLPWLLLFALWFLGIRWATQRAFPEPIFKPKPGEELGPVYIPSLFFHGSLVLALIGVLVTVLLADIRALWLAVPGQQCPSSSAAGSSISSLLNGKTTRSTSPLSG